MKSLATNLHKQYDIAKRVVGLVFIGLLLGLIILPTAAPAYADEGTSGKVIRVGYCNNAALISLDENEEYSGYLYDYLMEIAKYTDWKYKFVEGSVEECLQMLKLGSIDLVGTIQYTPERAELYEFSEHEIKNSQGVLYALSTNKDLCYQDYEAFDGMTVGMVKGSQDNQVFASYAAENNFSVKTKYYDDSTEAFRALHNKEVQAVADVSTIADSGIKAIDKFNVRKSYLIGQKGRMDIIGELNSAMNEILKNDMYFELKLSKKHFGEASISRQDFTREERNYIEENPMLRVVIDPNMSPFQKAAGDGNTAIAGVDADIIKCLADFAGMEVSFVPVDTYIEGYDALKLGEADIISTSPFYEFSDELMLTNEYNSVGMVILGRKDANISLSSPRIAVRSGYKRVKLPSAVIGSDAVVVEYDTIWECIDALEAGNVDITVVTTLTLDYLYRTRSADNLKVVRMLDKQMPICVGVSDKSKEILIPILNKSIANITEKQIEQATVNNTSRIQSKYSISQLFKDYGQWFMLLIAASIAFFVIVISYHRIKLMQQLKKIAYIDETTGYNTVERFKIQIKSLFSKYGQESYSLLYFDIERFKYFNDTYGLIRGNELLKYVAECVNDSIYAYESFARLSADNFVLLIKCTEPKEIMEAFRRIERSVNGMDFLQRNDYALIFSVGIYTYVDSKTDFNTALDRANAARKSVKGNHETAYGIYDVSMDIKIVQEQELIANMQAALENNEFVAYYQPKINLKTGEVCGAEALVRWVDPQRGIIPPDSFVPIFEANGFITKIDFAMFKQACILLRKLLDSDMPVVPISVNLSRAHMRSNKFIYKLAELADKYEIPRNLLELEITESMMAQDTEKINALLKQLKNFGFWVSMDDFGTGYSSLNLLKTIPVDQIKIDREFFSEVSSTPRERIIISDIVMMAHHLEMEVVSEGVETALQESILKDINCDVGQGYLYSRPLPKDDFLDYLKKNPVQKYKSSKSVI